jgi:hypothetical protein
MQKVERKAQMLDVKLEYICSKKRWPQSANLKRRAQIAL